MNALKIKYVNGKNKQKGATLLVIIIAMIVIATIGTAIYALMSTSMFNQVVAQRASRAFYLSESGIRIAASEYNAAEQNNAKLVALHNMQISIPGNDGKIKIKSNPYWFYVTASDKSGSSSTTLKLHLPGGVPPADADTDKELTFPAKGYLLLRDENRDPAWPANTSTSYTSITFIDANSDGIPDADAYGTPFTFTVESVEFAENILEGDEFYIGCANYTVVPPLPSAEGSTLFLKYTDIKAAKLFPPRKGAILIIKNKSSYTYQYDLRIIDASNATVKLTNMQSISSNNKWNILQSIEKDINPVYVGRVIGFTSNGTFGE